MANLHLVAIAKTVKLRDKSETAGAENADDDADDAGTLNEVQNRSSLSGWMCFRKRSCVG